MIKVFSAMHCVDGDLLPDSTLPTNGDVQMGDIVGLLTNLPKLEGDVMPPWNIEILLNAGKKRQRIRLPLEAFLTPEEYQSSLVSPLCFTELAAIRAWLARNDGSTKKPPSWLWLFRDGLYATEYEPRASEIESVTLRIKALHFQRDEAMRRLREQVANFEAVDSYTRGAEQRKPLPDDVKLLVWTRDGGTCVKCGSGRDLHFDHIIPFSRGGSDSPENIQLLCRACNLSKSDRLV